MKALKLKGFKYVVGGFVLLIVIVSMIVAIITKQQEQQSSYGAGQVPQAVLGYKDEIEEELAKYGLEEHIHLVLAIVTQESGGTSSLDIMQSSESLGLPPNSIKDPSYSIQVGVKYFNDVIQKTEKAGADLDTAIQAYNMGHGYIDFVAENGGMHSKELAQQFSNQMKQKLGWNVYGDPNYIAHVKRYVSIDGTYGNAGIEVADGEFLNPYVLNTGKYIVSSEFGMRIHPIYGTKKLHGGIDLAPYGEENLPIVAVADGTVTISTYHYSAGNYINIQHENGLTTRYLHLAQPSPFKTNQRVKQGDIIGMTGTTGASTGVHLHFETHEGAGKLVNPRRYIQFD